MEGGSESGTSWHTRSTREGLRHLLVILLTVSGTKSSLYMLSLTNNYLLLPTSIYIVEYAMSSYCQCAVPLRLYPNLISF